MLKTIFKRALAVIMKKPLALWGISLLCTALTGITGALCGAVPVLAIAINMLLTTSMTMVYLHGYRGEGVKTVNLFDCFADWATIKRVLCGMSWMALWVFLWALIPIVGPIFAIIRTYEYRLVPYILVTEPEVSPTEAIKVSKKRTNGYKGKMFLAELLTGLVIFFGLLILGLLTAIPYIGILFGIVTFVVTIAVVALTPLFLGLVQAAFYEEISHPTMAHEATASFCPACGAAVVPGTGFCTSCGNKLN